MYNLPRSQTALAIIFILIVNLSCKYSSEPQDNSNYISMADTLESSLFSEIIGPWYPLVIDTVYGGYLSNFSYDWQQLPDQDKYLVYEARHIWTLSFLFSHYPENKEFLSNAKHGFLFLKDNLWDVEFGGFYYAVDQAGIPLEKMLHEKRVYGQAFAIYALSEYYKVSQNLDALDLVKKAFEWIEENSHDKEYGGYFESLNRDGSPVLDSIGYKTTLNDKLAIGLKDYNSSIHILEALTSLYQVWPDKLVKERLNEMFLIIRDTMITEKGYLIQYFYANWERVPANILDNNAGDNSWFSEHVTFGHDIETTFLLYEAAEILDNHDDETGIIIKKLTDHTLNKGWDIANGGIYDKGKYINSDSLIIIDEKKAWWSQIEGLNSLLLMHSLYPDDQIDYYHYFNNQWNYINHNLIDHEFGGWYGQGLDKSPESKNSQKAHAWKTTYHNTRGMVNCINHLRELASVTDTHP